MPDMLAIADFDSPRPRAYAGAMDLRTEEILLDQARSGDEAGFEGLVRAHSGRVIGLAWRLVGNRSDAEEIAQEAFLRLHRSLNSFRGDSRLSTWLYRTVSRLAIDHLRREKLKRKLFFFRSDSDEGSFDPLDLAVADGDSPEDSLLGREATLRYRQALKGLSPRQRAVFVLRHDDELPLKEIAKVLGLEEGTVKVHLHRAVQQIRRAVNGGGEG